MGSSGRRLALFLDGALEMESGHVTRQNIFTPKVNGAIAQVANSNTRRVHALKKKSLRIIY
jgi:hypothetical protein